MRFQPWVCVVMEGKGENEGKTDHSQDLTDLEREESARAAGDDEAEDSEEELVIGGCGFYIQ